MNDKEFVVRLTKALENGDCPETLVKMAKTKWQKQVAVEFVILDRRLNNQETQMSTIKRISLGILTAVSIAAVVQIIGTIIPLA